MGIIRNSIEIIGLAAEEELPKQINGQLIEYSEMDYIYVPENRPLIYNISKIEVNVNLKESRTIEAPTGRIVVLEGSRKLNITYRPAGYYEQAYTLKLDLPFNSFMDLPNNAGNLKSVKVHVLDAYFKLMSSRKIYCFMVYMINAEHQNTIASGENENSGSRLKTFMQIDDED